MAFALIFLVQIKHLNHETRSILFHYSNCTTQNKTLLPNYGGKFEHRARTEWHCLKNNDTADYMVHDPAHRFASV